MVAEMCEERVWVYKQARLIANVEAVQASQV